MEYHRSSLLRRSSFLESHSVSPIGKLPIVCRFLKGVFNRRPPVVCVTPTWDIGQVISFIAEWHPPADISLASLSKKKKVAILLALCKAKRVSDLVLFSVCESTCLIKDDIIVLQTSFGSKTDRPSHRAPPAKLLWCEDVRLCPVSDVKEYIRRTESLLTELPSYSFHTPLHIDQLN